MLGEFLECTTTSIAGINGRGAVTLSRYNGLPLPGDVWGASAIDVDYTLTDQTTNPIIPKLEKGLGVITAGVLTRSKPRITWDGTTFDESAPTSLAFTGAPALGNVRVRVAPNADQFIQGPPAIYTLGGTFASWMPTANLIGPPGTLAGGGLTLVANREYYIPFLCAIRGIVTGMGVYVTTPIAASHIKMGIYGIGTNGLPGPCISQSAIIDTINPGIAADQVVSGWAIRAGPLMLRCSWLYLAILADAAIEIGASTRASLAGPTPLGQIDQFGWGSIVYRNTSNTYAAGLPTSAPTGAYTNPVSAIPNSVPAVVLSFAN